jgi:hypothetical protein
VTAVCPSFLPRSFASYLCWLSRRRAPYFWYSSFIEFEASHIFTELSHDPLARRLPSELKARLSAGHTSTVSLHGSRWYRRLDIGHGIVSA